MMMSLEIQSIVPNKKTLKFHIKLIKHIKAVELHINRNQAIFALHIIQNQIQAESRLKEKSAN